MATPANTPSVYYLDTADAKKKCERDKKEMEKKCAPDEKNKSRGKGRPKAREKSGKGANDASWVLDHCGPLMVQPDLENFSEWMEEFKDIDKMLNQLAGQLKDNVISKLEQEILEYAGKKAIALAARRGLTGWIPVVGWVMTAVDVATTAVEVTQRVGEMKEIVNDLKGTVERLNEAARKITGTLNEYKDKLKDFGKLSEKEQKKVANEVMTDIQSAYGAANPCLRARKCMLVPYNKGTDEKWQGKGCCPGQTGHHILPDAMFRDVAGSEKAKAEFSRPLNFPLTPSATEL